MAQVLTEVLADQPNAEILPLAGAVGTIVDGHYLPPPQDKDGKIWARTSALIQARPEDLYTMWRNLEAVPLWQEKMIRVTVLSPTRSEWVMEADGTSVKWTSEILADEPGKRIAWTSVEGDVPNAGEVVFETAPGNRGTIVTVLQEFRVGKLASMWETITGRNPKQAVIENLRHFKALAEAGEIPRIQGQSHGDRGIIGKVKKSMYGENIETPAGVGEK